MGSKNRYAKYLLPIMLEDRLPDQYFVDMFAGGCNMIDKVDGNRIANDIHPELMAMWNEFVHNDTLPPSFISEDTYHDMKKNPEQYEPWELGYVGFSLSFGGKWFGGYRRDKAGTKGCIENMKTQSRRSYNSMVKQIEQLQDVTFTNQHYMDVEIPDNSIVYCDPPYANTTKYKTNFDHNLFWDWVRETSVNHTVYVSEYTAPDDFQCVWSKPVTTTIDKASTKQSIEKLFTIA